MTSAQLWALGEAAWGPEWQTPAADAVGISPRTMRRYAAGSHPIPAGVAADLRTEALAAAGGLQERAARVRALVAEMGAAA